MSNEKAYVFVVALLLIVLISVMGLSLMTITSNTLKVTQHERKDQSVYYIAEAGLNEKKVEIIQELDNLIVTATDDVSKIKDDKLKNDEELRKRKIIERYWEYVEGYFNSLDLTKSTHNSYEKINNSINAPESNVFLEDAGTNRDTNTFRYTIKSIGTIDETSRTITQTFTLAKPILVPDDSAGNIPEEKPNFCYGILAESITTGNDYNSSNPFSPDIVSLKDDIIISTGQFNNIYSSGAVSVNNTATIAGDTVALSNITISNGATFKKNVVSNGNIEVTGGTPTFQSNVFSLGNINLKTGVTSNGFLYAEKDFISSGGSSIDKAVYGKRSINNLAQWANLGSIRYSTGAINHAQNPKKNIKLSEADFLNLAQSNINISYYTQLLKPKTSPTEGECGNPLYSNLALPTLPNFLVVDSSSFEQLNDISLNWNSVNSITLPDKAYINKVELKENRTLTIDTGNDEKTSKTLVIDKLLASNPYNGHLQIVGKGKLSILVLNTLSLKNVENSNNRSPFDNMIYYAGVNPITIDGNSAIHSSIYAKQADINLTGSGKILGNIFLGGSQKITSIGGSSFGTKDKQIVILGPDANFQYSGGVTINGAVALKKFAVNNGNITHHFDKSKLNLDGMGSKPNVPFKVDNNLIITDPQKEI